MRGATLISALSLALIGGACANSPAATRGDVSDIDPPGAQDFQRAAVARLIGEHYRILVRETDELSRLGLSEADQRPRLNEYQQEHIALQAGQAAMMSAIEGYGRRTRLRFFEEQEAELTKELAEFGDTPTQILGHFTSDASLAQLKGGRRVALIELRVAAHIADLIAGAGGHEQILR